MAHSIALLHSEAQGVYNKFHTIFTLFAECHFQYNSGALSERQIDQLGKFKIMNSNAYFGPYQIELAIKRFFEFFDKEFPDSHRSVKMHILEHHMVDWIRYHHAGCGLMGEQGAESIHSKFNNLKATFKSVHDPVERLMCIMKEHYLSVSPKIHGATPPKKKRKN